MFEEEKDAYLDELEKFLHLNKQILKIKLTPKSKRILIKTNNEEELAKAKILLTTIKNIVNIMVSVNYNQTYIPTEENLYVQNIIDLLILDSFPKQEKEEGTKLIQRVASYCRGHLIADRILLNKDYYDYICQQTALDRNSNISKLKIETAIETLNQSAFGLFEEEDLDNIVINDLPQINSQLEERLQVAHQKRGEKTYKK